MVDISLGNSFNEELFGPIFKYIKDDTVTDIDFDGTDLWLINEQNERMKADASEITDAFIAKLADKVGTRAELPFNVEYPVLEAELNCLRLTIVHESIALMGKAFTIRKSLPKLRFTAEQAICENMYCSK